MEQGARPSAVNISRLPFIIKKAADLGKKTEGEWKQRLKWCSQIPNPDCNQLAVTPVSVENPSPIVLAEQVSKPETSRCSQLWCLTQTRPHAEAECSDDACDGQKYPQRNC